MNAIHTGITTGGLGSTTVNSDRDDEVAQLIGMLHTRGLLHTTACNTGK